ncbi:MAG TPA: hypothetical protein VFL98_00940 [Candidatus Paceibacterota bacterium]|nr:hypothetical protein [Candidatus Paceibacterota bacterium]
MTLRPAASARGATALGIVIAIFAALLAVILGLAFVNQPSAAGGAGQHMDYDGVVGGVTPADTQGADADDSAAGSMSAAEQAHAGISTSTADAMAAHGTDNGPMMEDGVIPADSADASTSGEAAAR